MKKMIKSRLFFFILGALIFSSIGVVAITISAKDISFTPANENWNVSNIEEAINDLYKEKKVTPMNMNLKGVIMGKNVERTSYDAIEIDNLDEYKKITIQCGETVGTWIDAKIYIDDQLVLTISDKLEHTITLDNNSKLKITCVTKNNLGLGGISFNINAE